MWHQRVLTALLGLSWLWYGWLVRNLATPFPEILVGIFIWYLVRLALLQGRNHSRYMMDYFLGKEMPGLRLSTDARASNAGLDFSNSQSVIVGSALCNRSFCVVAADTDHEVEHVHRLFLQLDFSSRFFSQRERERLLVTLAWLIDFSASSRIILLWLGQNSRTGSLEGFLLIGLHEWMAAWSADMNEWLVL